MKGELTRNGNTWTESKYWGGIRSALRRTFRFNWVPVKVCLESARRKYVGPNKLQKWEFRCATCGDFFMRREVEVDHITPCGSLRGPGDVAPFLARLHCESPDGYQVICKKCHKKKTAEERWARTL
jgi:5-methylcytosine-specific restriction endonuclease McrA